MKRIFFLNRFFPPDHSATSQLVGDLAIHLAAGGNDVHVITSQQLYDEPQARLPPREIVSGVQVLRVATTQFGRSKLVGRAIDHLSFYTSARRALLAVINRDDILVAMTDPPLISIVGMQVAKRRDAHLVNWLQDIYPEVAVELGVPFVKGPIFRGISYLRDRSLKTAAANVVLGHHMADKVASRGVSKDRIHFIPNWSEDDEIVPVAPRDNPLRHDWGLENKFVIGYSGNLGRAHEFDTIVAAAERLRNNSNIVFAFIGGGHLMDRLAKCVKELDLSNCCFMDYQDRAVLKFSLCVPDIHWISLKPEVEGLIVPSKIYGVAAAGRPVIAICAKDGEIAQMVTQHQCGVVIEPGHADALVESILRLSEDVELRAAMGLSARAMLEADFTRRQAFERWTSVLQYIE
jgi:glycosyltransferase involved in cell wall biosynthesis